MRPYASRNGCSAASKRAASRTSSRSWCTQAAASSKTWLRGTFHGVSPKHLQRYLDEFAFRFDRRWRKTELFIRVLYRALDAVPCPYQLLTAERIGSAENRLPPPSCKQQFKPMCFQVLVRPQCFGREK